MHSFVPWLVLLAPLSLVIVTLTASSADRSRAYAGRAILGASVTLGTAALTALAVAVTGTLQTGTFGWAGIGLGLYVDTLAAIMLLLVSFVGLVVIRYSRNYLDGDAGHRRFTTWLLLTLASVLTLIISGNLAQFILAWIATSLSLHKLLLFYGDRPAAVRAARKKLVASRLGDACLIAAAALLYTRLGTLDVAELLASARSLMTSDASSPIFVVTALLIVVTAMLKSAQLPLHGWLIEVMETPTPVSALLHAGIINAGGFLVLRLADVLLLATPALEVLAIVGGATALFGSMVMLTQTSVKVQLAYSTIAQMGFMLLQCGLGAFSSAVLHIVAHSLYKAHAFLSSGSIIDLARASWSPSPGGQPHPARLAVAILAVLGLTFAMAHAFGFTAAQNPGHLALGAVLLMGLVHLMANAIDERPNPYVLARCGALAAIVAAAYFALQAGFAQITGQSLPLGVRRDTTVDQIIATIVIASFAAVTVFQNQMARHADDPFWVAAYVHLRQGFYLNTIANRLVQRHWPQPAKPSSPS